MQFDANGILDTTAFDSTVNGAYAADEATLQAVYGSKQSADEIVAGSTTGSKVQAIGDAIESVVIAKDGTKFGFSSVYLEGDRVFGRAQETNLGDLSADANIFKAQQALGAGVPAVVSLKNGGGLRASIGSIDEDGGKIGNPIGEGAAGNVSQLDVENALRFDNKLMVFDTTPQGLLNILNFAAGLAPGNGGFPQVGGIRFSYDPDLPADARVLNVALYDIDGNFIATVVQNGAVVADAPASIPVVILNFTAQGGDGYPIKPNGDNFRYLLNDGTLSAPLDDSLDFTAAANVPANALGEQKAFQDLMLARHNTEATAYDQADTPAAQDLRIENLNVVPTDAVIPCFAAGTRIMTLRGEVAVEHLREGDAIQGHFAAGPQDVVWIGQRTIDCRHHPEPHKVWPVCVARGAFGRGLPQRDLWLSPDHGVFVEGVLVPIKYLINDTSVRQMAVEQVTYYHVELPRHDVILAEGLPAESYLDTGDRSNFANGGGPIRLFADFSGSSASPYLWEAYGCAPLRIVGAEVEAARRLLRKRAARAKPNGRRDAAATDRGGKRRVGKAS
ncbi:MAG: Hint domain-containing protein [Acetobacteraceae bacterium]